MKTYIKPEKEDTAISVLRRITAGRTPADVAVLWVGDYLALVRHPGGHYSDNGGRHYVSPWVDLVDIQHVGQRYGQVGHLFETMWRTQENGRLTNKRLKALILECHERDEKWPAKVVAQQAQKDAEAESDRQVRAAAHRIREVRERTQVWERELLRLAAAGEDDKLLVAAESYRKARADLDLVHQGIEVRS